jgi:hypothetical protein
MKRIWKLLLLFFAIGLSIACLVFFLVIVNQGITVPVTSQNDHARAVNLQANAFIHNGWEAQTNPANGFLCWQIYPYTDKRVALNAASPY